MGGRQAREWASGCPAARGSSAGSRSGRSSAKAHVRPSRAGSERLTPHQDFAIGEASQVGDARRAAVRLGTDMGCEDAALGRLALVVTELGNNLVRHATRGRLLVTAD